MSDKKKIERAIIGTAITMAFIYAAILTSV